MPKKYDVMLWRNCSANNNSVIAKIEIPDDYKLSVNQKERFEQFRSFINTQHPKIAYPCKFDEYKIASDSYKGKINDKETKIERKKSKVKAKKNRPLWLLILLFPFKIIGWIYRIFIKNNNLID